MLQRFISTTSSRPRRVGAFFVVGVMLGAAGLPWSVYAQRQDRDRMGVGFVRADGVFVPIASRSPSGRWERLTRVRPGTFLTFMPADGSQSAGSIAVGPHVQVDSHCEQIDGYRVAVKPGSWQPDTFPIGTLGIAATHAARVDRVTDVSASDAFAPEAAALIGREFSQRQTRRHRSDTGRPALDIAIYADRGGIGDVFYFVANRTSFTANDSPSSSLAQMDGWITRASSGVEMRHVRESSDSEKSEFEPLEPIGTVRDRAGRVYWVARAFGYESESYVIVEASSHSVQVVFDAYGASC